MGTLAIKLEALAIDVVVTADTLNVVLADGREISAPIGWFPSLMDATDEQRRNWRLIGGGIGIRWEDLDEDISVAGLLSIR